MFNDSIFGLLVFVSAYIISRILSETALRKLSTEQKAALLDAFSEYRIYSLIGVVVIFTGYIFSVYFLSKYDSFINTFFFVLILFLMLANTIFAYLKLRPLNMPAAYMKSFWLSSVIQYIGAIVLFASLLSKYFG